MSDKNRDLHSLISGATLVLIGGVAESVLRLSERIILGRVLPPDLYGEANIAIIVMTFGTTIALLGYSHATTRYISRFESQRDVRGVWVTALLVPGVLGLVIAGILVANTDILASLLLEREESRLVLLLFILTIPFRVAFMIGVNAFRGFENARYNAYMKDFSFPVLRIGIILLLFTLGYGIEAVGYAYLVATVVVLIVSHILLNRIIPLFGSFRLHVREMTVFAAPLVISTMLAFLLVKTDTLLLGVFRTSHEVGLYSAVVPLVTGMLLMLRSFGFMYLPIASRLDGESSDESTEEVNDLYRTTTKWVYVLTFPAFVAFVLFPADVLGMFFGQDYRHAWPALVILSVAYFFNVLAGLNRDTLSAIGYTKFLLLGYLVAFGANVGLDLLLIPEFGYTGAAVASATSLVALNAVLLVVMTRYFSISPFSSRNLRTFVALPVLVLPPMFLLSRGFSLSIVTLLPFLVLTGLVGIGVLGVVGGLGPEDRIVVDLFEEQTGIDLPLVRQYLPPE